MIVSSAKRDEDYFCISCVFVPTWSGVLGMSTLYHQHAESAYSTRHHAVRLRCCDVRGAAASQITAMSGSGVLQILFDAPVISTTSA